MSEPRDQVSQSPVLERGGLATATWSDWERQRLDPSRLLSTSSFIPSVIHPEVGRTEATAVPVLKETPESQVYDRLVALKVATSEIAMHLEGAWRAGLFRQLDNLIDVEEWDFSDTLPTDLSYRTFLRMIVFLGNVKRPALGATSDGNILAGWKSGRDVLTVECQPHDDVRYVLSKSTNEIFETAAGRTTTTRLPDVLSAYRPEIWFSVAQ